MGMLRKILPLAANRAPRAISRFRNNDRVIELQNWFIIGLTAAIAWFNYERVRLARIALYSTQKTNEILSEINCKITDRR